MSKRELFRLLLGIPWIVFFVYWIAAASRTRPTRQEESFASRYLVIAMMFVGYVLVFTHSTGIGFLGDRFIPQTRVGAILGVAFTWLGIGLAIWARYHLAEFWSARVTIKEDHQLIRTGPYARLRHPIYTGLILATIGTTLVVNRWRCVFGTCLVVLGFCLKARKEESMLSQQFGEAFREHRRRTGFLLPRFR
jgi:protein-S-isoprenylcysteine O-methyltransferase Ste14